MLNEIYLRRRSKVLIPDGKGNTPVNVIATFQKNISNLGYLLGKDATDILKKRPSEKVEIFYKELTKSLRNLIGAHRKFNPLYPNFPTEVMEMSEAQLYINAIIHYLTLGPAPFQKEKQERPPLLDAINYKIIGVGHIDDFKAMCTELFRSRTPFSPQDKKDVKWMVAQFKDTLTIPSELPCKENLAFLGNELLTAGLSVSLFENCIKTATDVLRLAVGMSDGDVSLAEHCKFRKFKRRERTALLTLIERAPSATEDMLRWPMRWIRLGERLHPGEYTNRFPKTAEAFNVLRNNGEFTTFNGHVELAIANKDVASAIKLLKKRPGDFARRLDHLARTGDEAKVARGFSSVAEGVSTPVLLQVMTHFKHRLTPSEVRVAFPKGNVAKAQALPNNLPALLPKTANSIVATCETALLDRFSKMPKLGSCYLDERLKNYLVPFSQRSASKSLRTLVRGSRLPLPDSDTLRFFVWWKNGKDRTDIDLSASGHSEDYAQLMTISYYNLRDLGGHHSGDITSAPKGAAEFIDLSIDKCRKKGIRYIAMTLNSYTNQPYCDLPECFAGWMAREHPDSGEIFEPKTVVDRIDITSDTRMCIPIIFDLEKREAIWSDLALTNAALRYNNVHSNTKGIALMMKAMTQLRKTDLHTLFDLHIKARGKHVTKSKAKTIFAVDEGITPFDLAKISADFM